MSAETTANNGGANGSQYVTRAELHAELAVLRAELRADIAELKSDLKSTIITTMIAFTAIYAGFSAATLTVALLLLRH